MGAYRIELGNDEAAEIRRVAHDRCLHAVDCLRDPALDPLRAIHEARKDMKKVRAVLRLVRPALGKKTYARENERFRDAGRLLSDTRDAQVRAAVIASLAERFASQPPAGGWQALQTALAVRPLSAVDLDPLRERAAAAIEVGASGIDGWSLDATGFELMRGGLRRAYARGRTGFREARADTTDENVHEWRKRAKDLWYQLRLLEQCWPEVIRATAAEAHLLTVLLGDDQDLVVLGSALDTQPAVGAAQREHLAKLIARRRDELQARAFGYGERLYAEKPKRFVRRLELYWESPEL